MKCPWIQQEEDNAESCEGKERKPGMQKRGPATPQVDLPAPLPEALTAKANAPRPPSTPPPSKLRSEAASDDSPTEPHVKRQMAQVMKDNEIGKPLMKVAKMSGSVLAESRVEHQTKQVATDAADNSKSAMQPDCSAAVPKKMPRKGKGKGEAAKSTSAKNPQIEKASQALSISDERHEEGTRPKVASIPLSIRERSLESAAPQVLVDQQRAKVENGKQNCRRCPNNCGFQVTWHESHCCKRCLERPGDHGKKCDRLPCPEVIPADASSYEGTWKRAIISGNELTWTDGTDDNKTVEIKVFNRKKFSVVLDGATYTAELKDDDKLHWDDDDVWIREKAWREMEQDSPPVASVASRQQRPRGGSFQDRQRIRPRQGRASFNAFENHEGQQKKTSSDAFEEGLAEKAAPPAPSPAPLPPVPPPPVKISTKQTDAIKPGRTQQTKALTEPVQANDNRGDDVRDARPPLPRRRRATAVSDAIEEFIVGQGIDESAANHFRWLEPKLQQVVMAAGPLLDGVTSCRANPSAMLIGRIRDAKIGKPLQSRWKASSSTSNSARPGLEKFWNRDEDSEPLQRNARSESARQTVPKRRPLAPTQLSLEAPCTPPGSPPRDDAGVKSTRSSYPDAVHTSLENGTRIARVRIPKGSMSRCLAKAKEVDKRVVEDERKAACKDSGVQRLVPQKNNLSDEMSLDELNELERLIVPSNPAPANLRYQPKVHRPQSKAVPAASSFRPSDKEPAPSGLSVSASSRRQCGVQAPSHLDLSSVATNNAQRERNSSSWTSEADRDASLVDAPGGEDNAAESEFSCARDLNTPEYGQRSFVAEHAHDGRFVLDVMDPHEQLVEDAIHEEVVANVPNVDEGISTYEDDADDVWHESDFDQPWENEYEHPVSVCDLFEYPKLGREIHRSEQNKDDFDMDAASEEDPTDVLSAIVDGRLDIKDVRKEPFCARDDDLTAIVEGRLDVKDLRNDMVPMPPPTLTDLKKDEELVSYANAAATDAGPSVNCVAEDSFQGRQDASVEMHDQAIVTNPSLDGRMCVQLVGSGASSELGVVQHDVHDNDTSNQQSMCVVAERVLANLADLTVLASEVSSSSDQAMERIHNALIGASEVSSTSQTMSGFAEGGARSGSIDTMDLIHSISGLQSEAPAVCDHVPAIGIEPAQTPHAQESRPSCLLEEKKKAVDDSSNGSSSSDVSEDSSSSSHLSRRSSERKKKSKTKAKRSSTSSTSSSSSPSRSRKKQRKKTRSRSRKSKKTAKSDVRKKAKRKSCASKSRSRKRKDVAKEKGRSKRPRKNESRKRKSSRSAHKRVRKQGANTRHPSKKNGSSSSTSSTSSARSRRTCKGQHTPSDKKEHCKDLADQKDSAENESKGAAAVSKPTDVAIIAYYLVERKNGLEQCRWPLLLRRSYTVGQDESADIRLQRHRRVSRRHCSIVLSGDGRRASIAVTDSSSNGTSVIPGAGMAEITLQKSKPCTQQFRTGLQIKFPVDDDAYTYEFVREKERVSIRKDTVDFGSYGTMSLSTRLVDL